MSLIYDSGNSPAPGTHVLVIAVGNYPHLVDGDKTLARKPLGLGQLLSPPESAKAFIEWCLAPHLGLGPGLSNAAAPLSTMEALISTKTPFGIQTPTGMQIPGDAIRANIQNSFDGWLSRVANNPANIGVLYFCGHGVMVANHYLLASDFGQSNGMPWANGIDITTTMRAAEREVAGALFFFVDACREIARDMALTLNADSPPLLTPDLTKPLVRTASTLIEATGEGRKAFAPSGGEVSRFTSALVTALSGYCGVKGPGSQTWDIDGETLAAAVRKLLEQGNPRGAPGSRINAAAQVSQQVVSGASVPLQRLSSCPKVKVQLDLTPTQKRALYELYLSSGNALYQQTCVDSIFQTEVPRGFYLVGARDNAGALPPAIHPDEELIPPFYGLTLEVP